MITTSFDPEAGTLYWYFTELIAGGTVGEAECAATLLLDADQQVIGLELELDASITRDDLALYENAAASLDATLRQWLEHGRHAVTL